MSQTKPGSSEPSEIAGRYQVIKKLGAGAFGTVYKAKDKILGRMLAIKTIRLEGLAAAGASLEELVERFLREARVSAQLKHPNIVTIYDVGDSDGMSYLAMEFIDGVGLDKLIASSGRLPLERAASLGAQVADALDFAHQNSVVHRDIKPANIMVESGDRVKVTDFGIAKVTNSGDHLTMTGSLLGTPSYMSPEQARGIDIDGRSDLFAVGCIFYEMLTGKKAFRGESITGLIFKIITEEPVPVREMEPSATDEAVRILAKALAKAPEARYQTGRELADDLLALTRPGASPTLRQTEMGTTPLAAGAPAAPTILGQAATAVRSAPTQMTPGAPAAPPTRVVPSPPPGAPPTRVVPPPPPPPPMAHPTPRPLPVRRGGGAGLAVGLVIGLVGFLGVAGAAAWYYFRPKTVDRTATLETLPPPPTTLAATPPSTEAPQTAVSTEPPVATTLKPQPTVASLAPKPQGRGQTAAPPPPPTREVAAGGTPNTGAPSVLDQEPTDGSDGGDAGSQLAQTYRNQQGTQSSGSFGSRRQFGTRPKSPPNLAPGERPAVAVLRHVINAEEAYKKQHGRYAGLTEMVNAKQLFLDVAVQKDAFERAGYQFQLSVAEDSFKLTAMPKRPGIRPFHGDDSGYIQAGVD